MITFQSSVSYPLYPDKNYSCKLQHQAIIISAFQKNLKQYLKLNLTSGKNKVQVSVYRVEKKQFTFHMVCTTEGKVIQYLFKQIAIDDQRIQIIILSTCLILSWQHILTIIQMPLKHLQEFQVQVLMEIFNLKILMQPRSQLILQEIFKLCLKQVIKQQWEVEAFMEVQDEYFTSYLQREDLTLEKKEQKWTCPQQLRIKLFKYQLYRYKIAPNINYSNPRWWGKLQQSFGLNLQFQLCSTHYNNHISRLSK